MRESANSLEFETQGLSPEVIRCKMLLTVDDLRGTFSEENISLCRQSSQRIYVSVFAAW
jgi:hypothetical protein